jgi:tetratricopeptide (TPR) repeat protein
MALEKQGQIDLAITNYNLTLERDPNSPAALSKLANLYLAKSDIKWRNTAVQMAEHANRLTQYQNFAYVETLAAAYAAVGSYSKAVTNADWARKLAEVRGTPKQAEKIKTELESYRVRQSMDATNQVR